MDLLFNGYQFMYLGVKVAQKLIIYYYKIIIHFIIPSYFITLFLWICKGGCTMSGSKKHQEPTHNTSPYYDLYSYNKKSVFPFH